MRQAQAPFVIRLIEGDIARAQASMLVVNHFNGVAPGGAQDAIDRALGGALTRRGASGGLDGRFGTTHFLPSTTSSLAATSVLVVSLGEPEEFSEGRLPEVGAAIVEAAATLGLRDAATILHGAGSTAVDPERAAYLLVSGALAALHTVEGAQCFRELSIVEHDPATLPKIEAGVMAARSTPQVHVYLERGKIEGPSEHARAPLDGQSAVPDHLRIGITRAGTDLKITVIGHGAYDVSAGTEYPTEVATNLARNLQSQVLEEPDPQRRAEALCSIGHQLHASFLDWTTFGLSKLIDQAPGGLIVLRLDEWTVDLPWEILFAEGCFLSRTKAFARQLEIGLPGRQNAFPPPREAPRVLVVGDPTGDLPGAREEAQAVAESLKAAGAEVTALIKNVSYKDVSRELDSAANYDILHYAGHAQFDPLREEASGLALQDHTLTAADLSTRRFLPRLFFANACNSAQTGEGTLPNPFEGSQPTRNMVSGLLAAGVRAFIGSMWRVDDAAARTFATTFYDALLGKAPPGGNVVSIGQAVGKAREAVITTHGEGQHAWASYALYGSPWKPAL